MYCLACKQNLSATGSLTRNEPMGFVLNVINLVWIVCNRRLRFPTRSCWKLSGRGRRLQSSTNAHSHQLFHRNLEPFNYTNKSLINYLVKVNLAIADILVVLFCLPATLLANIFVRKYYFFLTIRAVRHLCYTISKKNVHKKRGSRLNGE